MQKTIYNKEYFIDESQLKKLKVYDYTDLIITKASNAAHIIKQIYTESQIGLVEYGGFLSLDEEDYVYGYTFFSKGGIVSTIVDSQIVFKSIELTKAKKVIFFHNHPSGNLMPSEADIQNTYMMSSIIKPLKVEYIDHVIVSPLGFYSFAEDTSEKYFTKEKTASLKKYAASGLKLKEATYEVSLPELKLSVLKNNVTEDFYKANPKINAFSAVKKEYEKLLLKEQIADKEFVGFFAINNAGRIDQTHFRTDFNFSSQSDFNDFAASMLSCCAVNICILINKKIAKNESFSNEETQFVTRLGALGEMVGLRYNEVVVRNINTGEFSSVIDQIVAFLNNMLGGSRQDPYKNIIKFVNI